MIANIVEKVREFLQRAEESETNYYCEGQSQKKCLRNQRQMHFCNIPSVSHENQVVVRTRIPHWHEFV